MIASTSADISLNTDAALLAAAGDVTRLGILKQLTANGPTCVCHLESSNIAPNLLSYHLRILREAGLVHTKRLGRMIEYSLADDALARLHSALPIEVDAP